MAEGRTVACTSCGLHIDPVKAAISPQGTLVCPSCRENPGTEAAKGRVTALPLALGAAFVSLVPSPFLEMPTQRLRPYEPVFLVAGLAATALGLASLWCTRRAENRRALGRLFSWTFVAAVTGTTFGVVTVLAVLLG